MTANYRHSQSCRCPDCMNGMGLRKFLARHSRGEIHQEDLPDTMESNCLHCQRLRGQEARLTHGSVFQPHDREARIAQARIRARARRL